MRFFTYPRLGTAGLDRSKEVHLKLFQNWVSLLANENKTRKIETHTLPHSHIYSQANITLSLTHTHTHTHTQPNHHIMHRLSLSLHSLSSLSHTHTRPTLSETHTQNQTQAHTSGKIYQSQRRISLGLNNDFRFVALTFTYAKTLESLTWLLRLKIAKNSSILLISILQLSTISQQICWQHPSLVTNYFKKALPCSKHIHKQHVATWFKI